ncbi:FecR family protein [Pedobacter agri]|uniref:FecR family protein n=1 Tax=Pedobacter agri TaxID=454586 RepID=UPI00292E6770|nr:FecR family protein [Pedobacter agri]
MSHFSHQKDLQNIIKRYLAGTATAEEIKFIEKYYAFLGEGENEIGETHDINNLEQETFQAIQAKIASQQKSKVLSLYKFASAAAIFILLCGGLYFLLDKNSSKSPSNSLAKIENLDILPGSDKATLTLANGSKVILDDQTPENISDKHGVKISKTKDGQLVYTVVNNENLPNSTAFNTIQTPKGGQYQVILPDGTKVWLNAASSLNYPEVFAGKKRSVTLTGEAYFEVAKDKDKPFHVLTQNQNVEVLGTHFNINGYLDDHTIKTTLLEGAVKVSNLKSTKKLKPGEQAISGISENALIKVTSQVDTDDEIAWKNGLFQFNDTDLKIILNQLERWYDIKIDYSSIPDKRYNGMVPRKSKLSEVLKMLEKTGNIKFELLENRSLKVIPKNN